MNGLRRTILNEVLVGDSLEITWLLQSIASDTFLILIQLDWLSTVDGHYVVDSGWYLNLLLRIIMIVIAGSSLIICEFEIATEEEPAFGILVDFEVECALGYIQLAKGYSI